MAINLDSLKSMIMKAAVSVGTAQAVHYALASAATIALIYVYVTTHPHEFNVGFGTWVIAFWGTAFWNDKLNTPPPTN